MPLRGHPPQNNALSGFVVSRCISWGKLTVVTNTSSTSVVLDNNWLFLVHDPVPKRPAVCVQVLCSMQTFRDMVSFYLMAPSPSSTGFSLCIQHTGHLRVSGAAAHGRVLGARPESGVNSPLITFLCPSTQHEAPPDCKGDWEMQSVCPGGENMQRSEYRVTPAMGEGRGSVPELSYITRV